MLPGGMVKLELVLEPDEADLILRAVERAREVQAQETRAQQAAPCKQEAPSAPDAPDGLGKAEAAETSGVSAAMLSSA